MAEFFRMFAGRVRAAKLGSFALVLISSPSFAAGSVWARKCDVYASQKLGKAASAEGVSYEAIDASKTIEACEAAVRENSTEGRLLYQLGRGYQKAGRRTEALNRFWQAAELGYAFAYIAIGGEYETGTAVEKNEHTAFEWYRKGAEAGNPAGQYTLALSYEFGRGISPNIFEALKWYRASADQGLAEAEEALGHLHMIGYGVERSDVLAAGWFRKAAKRGLSTAEFNLANLYENSRDFASDRGQAILWYERSAHHGSKNAQDALARLKSPGTQTASSPTSQFFQSTEVNGSVLKTRGVGYVPGALLCPDYRTLMIVFAAYNTSMTERLQSKLLGNRFQDLAGAPAPLPDLSLFSCYLMPPGTTVTLISNDPVPRVSAQLSDGMPVSGVTLPVMIGNGNAKGMLRP